MRRAVGKKRTIGRPGGTASKRGARASRANGKKGGRPRDKLPDDVLKALGEPPATAKDLRLWCARVLAVVLARSMRGTCTHELAATLRANVKAVLGCLPSQDGDDEPGDEDDDDFNEGAELEDDDQDEEEFGGLRVA